jgi:hypothetical protein
MLVLIWLRMRYLPRLIRSDLASDPPAQQERCVGCGGDLRGVTTDSAVRRGEIAQAAERADLASNAAHPHSSANGGAAHPAGRAQWVEIGHW